MSHGTPPPHPSPAAPPREARLVGDGLRVASILDPRANALVSGGRRWSRGELEDAVRRTAAALAGLSLAAGQRIAICLPPGAPHLIALLAAARAGLVAAVLGPESGDGELAACLVCVAPAAIVTAGRLADRLRFLGGPGGAYPLRSRWRPAIPLIAAATPAEPAGPPAPAGPGAPASGDRAAVSPPPAGSDRSVELVVLTTATGAAAASAAPPSRPPQPGLPRRPLADAPFYVGFTSGSTGRPQGIVRQHAAWVRSFAVAADAFGLGSSDRFLVAGSFGFSAVLFFAVGLVDLGGEAHVLARFDAHRVLSAIRRERITGMFLVPSQYRALLRAAGGRGTGLASVRRLISCGEKLSPALREALRACFPAAEVHEFYGASEVGFATWLSWPAAGACGGDPPATGAATARDGATAVGWPLCGVQVEVRRADGLPAATGEIGRLHFRSRMLAFARLEAPERLVPLADPTGFVSAGDTGWLDPAGCVHLQGRSGTRLNVGGAKVHPGEVEAVLAAHPAVAEAVAFGRPSPARGQEVWAAVVPLPGRGVTAAELRAFCRARLAPHKRPRGILVVERLPRNAAGKVDRAALAREAPARTPGCRPAPTP